MKKDSAVIFLVTMSPLVMSASLTSAYSNPDIAVQSGPVEVKQGNNVSLWCKLEGVAESELPVHWQSPPNFRTRTANCLSFVKEKYWVSCAKSPLMWYNMTVMDVQWTDKGKYRCIHISLMAIVDLQVLVPVTEVSLIQVSNSTAEPLFVRRDVHAALTCSTNCAYPAPEISWFENGQSSKGRATITTTVTDLGCSGKRQGQNRTISTMIVTGKYAEEREEAIISCEAGNVFGEKNISKAITVIYAAPCESVRCPPGLVCQATSKNPGVCVCGPSDFCDGHRKQVCGDDGTMYSSLCELHRTACIKGKHIGVDHTKNTCKSEVTPSPPQPVMVDVGTLAAAVIIPVLVAIAITFLIIFLWNKRRSRNVEITASKQHSELSVIEMTEKNNLAYLASTGNQSDIKEDQVMGVGQGSTKPEICENIKEPVFKPRYDPSGDEMNEKNNDDFSENTGNQSDIGEDQVMRTGLSVRRGQVDSARTDSSRNSETPLLRLSTDSNVPKENGAEKNPKISGEPLPL